MSVDDEVVDQQPIDPRFLPHKQVVRLLTYAKSSRSVLLERGGRDWAGPSTDKNLRQNATPPVSSPGAADAPIVAVSALWALTDWIGQRA